MERTDVMPRTKTRLCLRLHSRHLTRQLVQSLPLPHQFLQCRLPLLGGALICPGLHHRYRRSSLHHHQCNRGRKMRTTESMIHTAMGRQYPRNHTLSPHRLRHSTPRFPRHYSSLPLRRPARRDSPLVAAADNPWTHPAWAPPLPAAQAWICSVLATHVRPWTFRVAG